MSKLALVFPGQGSQIVGMGKDFYEKEEVFRNLLDKINELLDTPLKEKIFNGPAEQLKLTENTQPAILAVSYGIYQVLLKKKILSKPDFVLGHSLGEYTALLAAEAGTFEEFIPLVKNRGKFMQDAVPEGIGAMAAILGFDKEKIESLCWEEGGEENKLVVPANYNSPAQTVISGVKEAVENVAKKAKELGARRVIFLDVSAPFHSTLMKKAADKLKIELDKINFNKLKYPIITNVDARIHDEIKDIPGLLYFQTFSPVRWEQSVNLLAEKGVTHFLEIGPGKTLSGLIRSTNSELKTFNVEKYADIDKLKDFLKDL